MNKKTLPTDKILAQIKQRFYDPHSSEKRFYEDRRMLLYTVTWPATWLDRRGLPTTSQAYQRKTKDVRNQRRQVLILDISPNMGATPLFSATG